MRITYAKFVKVGLVVLGLILCVQLYLRYDHDVSHDVIHDVKHDVNHDVSHDVKHDVDHDVNNSEKGAYILSPLLLKLILIS